jgi:hypothetical protein
MRSRFPRHLRYLTLALVLLGAAGAVVGATGLPLATSACGCEAKKAEFLLTGRSTDEFDTKADVTSPLKLEAKGSPTIECSKERIEKGVVTNESAEATIKAFDWEECKDTTEETTCEVPTIKTNELTDTLQEDGEDAKGEKETDEKFKPKSGEVIAEFEFKNKGSETCSVTGKKFKIEGDFISKKEDNDVSEEEHNLGVEVKPENKELEYGDQVEFALFRISLRWTLVIPIIWVLF